jgi:PilZ domain.
MTSETLPQERRKHSRITFQAPATLIFPDQIMSVVVIDLSLKGALILLPTEMDLRNGGICKLHIPLNGTHHKISMDARVAHAKKLHVGIVCESIDIYSITHLRRLIELNLGDPALLGRELCEMLTA